jgi:hypothetical protein
MHPGQLPLQDGEIPALQQQVAPSEKPPTPEVIVFSEIRSGSSTILMKEKQYAGHI